MYTSSTTPGRDDAGQAQVPEEFSESEAKMESVIYSVRERSSSESTTKRVIFWQVKICIFYLHSALLVLPSLAL